MQRAAKWWGIRFVSILRHPSPPRLPPTPTASAYAYGFGVTSRRGWRRCNATRDNPRACLAPAPRGLALRATASRLANLPYSRRQLSARGYTSDDLRGLLSKRAHAGAEYTHQLLTCRQKLAYKAARLCRARHRPIPLCRRTAKSSNPFSGSRHARFVCFADSDTESSSLWMAMISTSKKSSAPIRYASERILKQPMKGFR